MTHHRFKLDEMVAASGLGVPSGPYRIRRLLPRSDLDGMPQYRLVSAVDRHERVVTENVIRLLPPARQIASKIQQPGETWTRSARRRSDKALAFMPAGLEL
jgi:hypothetical protein